MKKIIPFVAIGFLFSCKSDYTCVCVQNQVEIHVKEIKNSSRQIAVSTCNALTTTFQISNPGTICIIPD